MTVRRLGTRGSDLALAQVRIVLGALARAAPGARFEIVILATDGDLQPQRPIDALWPVGGFVGTIEQALLDGRIDVAVHSHKDLPSQETPGLRIAAIPARAAPQDVLITAAPVDLAALPAGLRIGTSSARRAAQLRRLGPVEPVPMRGNVPSRLERVGRDLDGVMLAAAGIDRLGLRPAQRIDLPVDVVVPAPAQGALAVQVRSDDDATAAIVRAIHDEAAGRCVAAERAVLTALHAGCQAALGALAALEGDEVAVHGQLYADDGDRWIEATARDRDPGAAGRAVAARLFEGAGGAQ